MEGGGWESVTEDPHLCHLDFAVVHDNPDEDSHLMVEAIVWGLNPFAGLERLRIPKVPWYGLPIFCLNLLARE